MWPLVRSALRSGTPDFGDLMHLPLSEAKDRLLESTEGARIEAAPEQSAGNVSAAARTLGIHRQSLQQKMTQLGIRQGAWPDLPGHVP